MAGKRDIAGVGGKWFVAPDLAFDRDRYIKAVKSSAASNEEKARLIAERTRLREERAKELLPGLLENTESFRPFLYEHAKKYPDGTYGEAIAAFKAENGGAWEKHMAAFERGVITSADGVPFAIGAVGQAMKGASKWKPLGEFGNLRGDGSKIVETEASGPLADAGDALLDTAHKGFQYLDEMKKSPSETIDALGGDTFTTQLAEVGGQLVPTIAATILSGGTGTIVGEAVKGSIKKGVKSQLVDEIERRAAKTLIANGKSKLETVDDFTNLMNRAVGGYMIPGASSGGPAYFDAYQRHRERLAGQGLNGEDLEVAARSEAMGAAFRHAAITGTITSMFGLSGAEAVARLGQVATNPASRAALSDAVKRSVAQKIGMGTAGEALEEGLDEALNGALDALIERPDMTWDEWSHGVLLGATAGAIMGGGTETATSLAEGIEFRAENALRMAEASPEVDVRRDTAARLRESGMDQLADALEADTEAKIDEALTETLPDIEQGSLDGATRLDEIEARIADPAASAEEVAALQEERESIAASLSADPNAAPETDPYNPQRTANVAVAELVSQGMDKQEAIEAVGNTVMDNFLTTPVTPDVLWRLARVRAEATRAGAGQAAPDADADDAPVTSALEGMEPEETSFSVRRNAAGDVFSVDLSIGADASAEDVAALRDMVNETEMPDDIREDALARIAQAEGANTSETPESGISDSAIPGSANRMERAPAVGVSPSTESDVQPDLSVTSDPQNLPTETDGSTIENDATSDDTRRAAGGDGQSPREGAGRRIPVRPRDWHRVREGSSPGRDREASSRVIRDALSGLPPEV
ncbi:MAG: hypothetical protein GXX91_04425, partial [Verrucomicrobiaceae bacterium]|nr:hypothetical protein [Verrucomicrobiaceae bacterium]